MTARPRPVPGAASTTDARPGPVVGPGRLLVAASLLVVVACLAMVVLGALRTGISWDEPYHVMRLRNFLERGSFALDWAFVGDGPTSGVTNTAVYGPVTTLLLHGFSVLVGAESWGGVATTPAAYASRHLGVVLIGVVGTAATAAVVRVVLGSWRWALVGAAVLLSLPMWSGHLMFNIKDVPVATGYTLVTLALVCMVPPGHGRRAQRVVTLTVGVVLMVGTRPAMASAVAVGVAVLVVGAWRAADARGPLLRAVLLEVGVGVLAAATTLVLLYPAIFAHPDLLLQSAEQSASFRDGDSASYGYVPFHVLGQIPLLLLGFFALGAVAATSAAVRARTTDPAGATRTALVVLQVALLPTLAVVMHSDLYNGLRQLLFAAPAWAVLTTVGLACAAGWARPQHRAHRAVALVAAVALLAPTAQQLTLFPYQYTFYNAAVDAVGIDVSSDYWRTSVPELLPRIPTDGQVVCGPTRTGDEDRPETMTAGRYSSDSSVDCRLDPLGPLASRWAADGLPLVEGLPHGQFYVVIDRDHPLPANCVRLAGVTRERHLREVFMTYVARCTLTPSRLGSTPVRFERPVAEPNMAPELWAFAPQGWVMRRVRDAVDAEGPSAALTFRAPGACATRGCELVLDADLPDDLVVRVDDRAGDVRLGPRSATVRLPPGTTDAWVDLTRASGLDLDLRLRALRVLPAPDGTADPLTASPTRSRGAP